MALADKAVTVQVIDGPKVSVEWEDGMNAQTGLERAYTKINSASTFTYALQYYGSELGYLVCMINETYDTFPNAGRSAAQPYFYWDFLVNNEASTTGIDNTPLKPGDVIEFRFVPYPPASDGSSTLHAKYAVQTNAAVEA